jgi:hypothetical protein
MFTLKQYTAPVILFNSAQPLCLCESCFTSAMGNQEVQEATKKGDEAHGQQNSRQGI